MDPAYRHLCALARGRTRNPALHVERGPWSVAPGAELMRIGSTIGAHAASAADLGALCHEAAHIHASVYLDFAPLPGLSRPLSCLALNAIEDPRVHELLGRDGGPGPRSWIRAAQAEAMRVPPQEVPSRTLAFLFAAALGDATDYHPPPTWGLPTDVATALAETRAARRGYARDFLPPRAGVTPDHPDLGAAWEAEVRPLQVAAGKPAPAPPSHARAAVEVVAARAWRLAEAEIAPVVRRLLAVDQARLEAAAAEDRRLDRDLRRASGPAQHAIVADALRRGAVPLPAARDPVLRRALEAYLVRAGSQQRRSPGPLVRLPAGAAIPEARGRTSAARRAASTADQPALVEAADRQVEALVKTLGHHLRAEPRTIWSGGQRRGKRLDLRGLVQARIDPDHTRIMARRIPAPTRTAASLCLLVDLSGSMRGARIAHAAAAVGALGAAFTRTAGLDWRIEGFQDVLIPIARHGTPFDPAEARRLMHEEADNTRAGGNNAASHNDDGPCLREATAALPRRPGISRVVIVLSDGLPSGRRSNSEDLRNAVADLTADGVRLVGLGVGADTGHVTRFYPDSRADIPLEDLADAVSTALGAALRRG